jgi:hypothetical protein
VNGFTPEYVILPIGLKEIADNALVDNDKLGMILLPKNIKYIGMNAFK